MWHECMNDIEKFASWLLIIAGLILSVLSATDLCSFGGCTEAHQYRFFGINLPLLGTAFFLFYGFLFWLDKPGLPRLAGNLILAGGFGAEGAFTYIQKSVIQAWCPLCLGIATVVSLLIVVRLNCYFSRRRNDPIMFRRLISSSLMYLLVVAASFFITFTGMAKPDAEANDLNLWQGKQNSKVEVYVFSDWFCPSCIKAEPSIEAAFPPLSQKARILFVDKAVHPEAMNFVPYHLSFAAKEKGKYIELRKILFDLAKTTKNPTVDDVKGAIAPLNITYKQLGFLEVSQTMAQFQKLSDLYKVKGTPTVIITNRTSKKVKTLYGSNEITKDNLLKAVREMEK